MISRELAGKIRQIRIYTSRAVNEVLGGKYESVFKGRGVEFEEVREYLPGDDVRAIDWNVTARMGKPFIKRYREERELTVIFLVDLSASGNFGTGGQFKREAAAECCALLAFAAARSNDKAGFVLFTDRVEKFIPPKKGTFHVLRAIEEILSFRPAGTGTDVSGALDFCGRVFHRKAVVFLVGDFSAPPFERALRRLACRHDLIAVHIQDPREMELPNTGLLELEDLETGRIVLLDTGDPTVRNRYAEHTRQEAARLRNLFLSAGVDGIQIVVGTPYLQDIVKFFRNREKRR